MSDLDVNYSAEFLPACNAEELPAVRIGELLVFVYRKDGELRVTVDSEERPFADGPVLVRLNINGAIVWEGSAP